jgi:excisionase family DNA binding protein
MGNKLTSEQAAARLGVTRQTISQWVYEKKLPAEMFGRSLVTDEDDLAKVSEPAPTGRLRKGEVERRQKLKRKGKGKS